MTSNMTHENAAIEKFVVKKERTRNSFVFISKIFFLTNGLRINFETKLWVLDQRKSYHMMKLPNDVKSVAFHLLIGKTNLLLFILCLI